MENQIWKLFLVNSSDSSWNTSTNTSSTTETSPTNWKIQLPPALDYTFRVIFFLVHLFYFVLVALIPSLRKISLVHMHHTNLIGLLTGLHYCIWIAWTAPSTPDPVLNTVLCELAEVFWALSKFARCFSILVLAAYRLVAVYRIHWFKRIVNSVSVSLIAIAFVWLASAVVFVLAKFPTHTLPGLIYCYDGYSTSIESTIIYYVVTSLLGYFLPVFLIALAYVLIQVKLNSVGTKLRRRVSLVPATAKIIDKVSTMTENSLGAAGGGPTTSHTNNFMSAKKKKKEYGLARQFIIINVFEFAGCVFFVILSSCNVIVIFNTTYYFVRQLCRIANLICQTCIPVVSLVYTPIFAKLLKRIF